MALPLPIPHLEVSPAEVQAFLVQEIREAARQDIPGAEKRSAVAKRAVAQLDAWITWSGPGRRPAERWDGPALEVLSTLLVQATFELLRERGDV